MPSLPGPTARRFLRQLGVDMNDAGRLLSAVRVTTSTGRPLATLDVSAMVERLGAPVRMVPRRDLLERLLEGFPAERIHCNSRAVSVTTAPDFVRVEFDDGRSAEGDVLIGADGLHSVVRDVVGAHDAEPTGWCSWQGLVTLPDVAHDDVAMIIIGERGNTGLWPAGGSDWQWVRWAGSRTWSQSHGHGWPPVASRTDAPSTPLRRPASIPRNCAASREPRCRSRANPICRASPQWSVVEHSV